MVSSEKAADRKGNGPAAGQGRQVAMEVAADGCGDVVPRGGAVAAALAGLVAAWFAANSLGLLGHSLRHGLAYAAITVMLLAGWPLRKKPFLIGAGILALAVALLGLVPAIASWSPAPTTTFEFGVRSIASGLLDQPPLGALLVALALLALAQGHSGGSRSVLRITAEAVVVLAIFRLACLSVPAVWMAADRVGAALGAVAGAIARKPLNVGPTFASLDVLLTMLYLAIALPLRSDRTAGGLWRRLAIGLAAVAAAQMIYLIVLSLSVDVLQAIKPVTPTESVAGASPPPLDLAQRFRAMVPWNVPLLAGLVQLPIAWMILRWFRGPSTTVADTAGSLATRRTVATVVAVAALTLAVAAPVLTTLHRSRPSLEGKKIVLFEKGFLNWMSPKHGEYGRLSIGMYGMMPAFLESYGAKPVVSADLSDEDLQGADALVMFFPNERWTRPTLERIWKYVRGGGNLMVFGEHTVWEKDLDEQRHTPEESDRLLAKLQKQGKAAADLFPPTSINRFNEVVGPTAMRVKFDSAMFTIGGWLQSYDALAHPTAAGIRDERNEFGVVIGASVDARWPAQPFLIGRWGWNDPGDPKSATAMMGNHNYDPGERLGDVVLAAEQRLGSGKVILFGDPSGMTNGLTTGCHDYTSRLFAYAASKATGPVAPWRAWAALGALAGLAALVALWPTDASLLAAAVGMILSLSLSTAITHDRWTLYPDGSRRKPNNLAYIDTSRPACYTPEAWRPEGLAALSMTLMRNGFLALDLPEITPERLAKARVLISVAPGREYSARERRVIEEFVLGGGVFLSTVGYVDREPSKKLLSELGFWIGQRPEDDRKGKVPQPLGHFKTPFFNGGNYLAFVRFFAGWPIYYDPDQSLQMAYYPPDKPMIAMRRISPNDVNLPEYLRDKWAPQLEKNRTFGLVVVVADTFFAANKNLENEGGEPFEGMRENAVFWRYLLALLRNGMNEGEIWYPPAAECTPIAPAPAAASPAAPAKSPSKSPSGSQLKK